MATVLNAEIKHSSQNLKMAMETREDGSSEWLFGRMLARELSRITRVLSVHPDTVLKTSEAAQQILANATEHTAHLPHDPEAVSVADCKKQLGAIVREGKTGAAGVMDQKLETLRVSSYDVYPRNEQEIWQMIEVNRELKKWIKVFKLCTSVEALVQSPNPSRSAISQLQSEMKQIDGDGVFAFQIAKQQLEDLYKKSLARPVVDQPQTPSQQTVFQASLGSRLIISAIEYFHFQRIPKMIQKFVFGRD